MESAQLENILRKYILATMVIVIGLAILLSH
jgi:hypothetical protein